MALGARARVIGVGSLWTRLVACMVAVVAVLGFVNVGATVYQRSVAERTLNSAEAQLDAVTSLLTELRALEAPMGAVLYELGAPEQRRAHLQSLLQARARIDARWASMEELVLPTLAADLESARRDWDRAAEAVMAARNLWGTDEVQKALGEGRDPFASEWAAVQRVENRVTALLGHSVDGLRTSSMEVERAQSVVLAVVLGCLLLTLSVSLWSARVLRRNVVRPLQKLRDATESMRSGALGEVTTLRAASTELQQLCAAINGLSVSLDASHRELRDQANRDALTGLPNRKAVLDHLASRGADGTEPGTALLFIDLDDFKLVNDTFGHHTGDRLLQVVGERLVASARQDDCVARLGGDEFAVVLGPGCDAATAVTVAERMLHALQGGVEVEGRLLHPGCSIGVAVADAAPFDATELLRNADIAMYLAKGAGKRRLMLYTPDMHCQLLERVELQKAIGEALELGQFEVHYQPVVQLRDQAVVGWEALVRWRHPVRGMLAPAEFIPLAEETGQVVDIGAWVLDRACADFGSTLAAGSTRWVSVNVAADQLSRSDFVEVVRATLARHAVPPSSLVLEITESVVVADLERAARTLEALRGLGVAVALDDFGTGYSSLHYLHRLPVDIIKVDRSFVVADSDADDNAMLGAVLAMGRTLGMQVISEGVETVTELDMVRSLDGSVAQGYYFARPMPLAQAAEFTCHERVPAVAQGA